jgi:CBS domain containing-hemolysin-like protein
MLSATEVVTAFVLWAALLITSIFEVAFGSMTRISLRRLLEKHDIKPAPMLMSLLGSRSEILMSLQLLTQVLLVCGTVLMFIVFGRREVPYAAGTTVTIIVMFVVILLFRQFVPRLIAMRNPEMVLVRFFRAFQFCTLVMWPFSRLTMAILNYFHRWEEETEQDSEEETSAEEIQAFIDVGQEEGILERGEGQMIQSIVHFGEKIVSEVMTPRTQIVAIEVNAPVEKLLELITSERHARIPVYSNDLDNIEGVIHERALLRLWRRGEKVDSLRPLVKPVHFVPETKPVDDLLAEMKQRGDQMVIVVDEYGGVSGLVTMEDLVEEIVGEIHDTEGGSQQIQEESTGTYIVPGSFELHSLNEALGTSFAADTKCTTVGGAVVESFGRLPVAGEKIEQDGLSIEVLEADRRRVQRLRLRVLATRKP